MKTYKQFKPEREMSEQNIQKQPPTSIVTKGHTKSLIDFVSTLLELLHCVPDIRRALNIFNLCEILTVGWKVQRILYEG
ncbi:CLUMA_CG007365, isoform A [Clunio marinus]|uniref:CLUMA_CG007365, isoform A n=1 Tax=Clunio marinus TaxID=568069 RepID=A0A1J1I4M4_9DIPT|nr:CLUMA_CG007365, isoform A [Clunio marinus]